MVAVQLSGGLGNQMFEYALYLKLKSDGKDVKIDDFTCFGEGRRALQLSVFGLSYDRLTRAEYEALTDSRMDPVSRTRRKLTGRKDLSYREESVNFDPEVLKREPALLQGCFQTEKYFADIAGRVRSAFTFQNLPMTDWLKEWEEKITARPSVSVHIRRGDYLDPKYGGLYTGCCSDVYYEKAVGLLREKIPGVTFFFFSNDTAWVREHYAGADCEVVEGADESSGYLDLYLMSRCKSHIIANSSFSWWGAWLSESMDKQVIAPKTWLAGRECRDIYTKDMILL